MLKLRGTITNQLSPMLLVVLIASALAGYSQQQSTGSYKILDGNLLIITATENKAIVLATNHNFKLDDLTPCVQGNHDSPDYSCTNEEMTNHLSLPKAVYSGRKCQATQEQSNEQTWTDLTCTDENTEFAITGKVLLHGNQSRNLIVSSNNRMLFGGRLYQFTYWSQEMGEDGTVVEKPNVVALDTRPIVGVDTPPTQRGISQFILNSPLAFSKGGKILTGSPDDCPTGTAEGLQKVNLENAGTGPDLQVWTLKLATSDLSDSSPPPELLKRLAYLGYGLLCASSEALAVPFTPKPVAALSAIHASAPAGSSGPVVADLVPGVCADQPDPLACANSLPSQWVFGSGKKLAAPSQQPTGKSDSGFYANLNMVAGTGAKFAWGLDGKLAKMQQPIFGTWVITWLSATANVGNNTSNIKGQTYSDSIDWTLPVSRDWRAWNHMWTFVFAPDYNTDIEFDRKNMLADTHVMLTAAYHRLAWNTALESGADAKYSNTSIKSGLGWQLYLQGGAETGGAIVDTVQKGSSGNAKIAVPAYNIARIVPQMHGNLEWKPAKGAGVGVFTFDETFAGRYLMTTENTVEQYTIPASGSTAATVGLHLRPISGWKGYNSLVTTWFPPHSANAGLGITYNDGFSASKFSRVNSVTIGLTILF